MFGTFTEAQTIAILVVTLISSSASIFGASFIIINTIRLKKVKILFWRLLTCLSCTDLLLSVTEVTFSFRNAESEVDWSTGTTHCF